MMDKTQVSALMGVLGMEDEVVERRGIALDHECLDERLMEKATR